jgi:Holliday junction DNA helicase RuvA
VIGKLTGQIVERGNDGATVLDVNGVGYELFVPLGTLGRLPMNETISLHVHTHVREDALVLYGFATGEDRIAFRTLLSVSSVGPKLALAVLSHLSAKQLAAAIAREDRTAFQSIPGVGKKIVERLVLELKDKVGLFASASSVGSVVAPTPIAAPRIAGPLGGVASMLVTMGFRPSEAERAVAAIAPHAEGKDTGALLREALAALG